MTEQQKSIAASISSAAEAYLRALAKHDYVGADRIANSINTLSSALHTLGRLKD